MKIIRIIVTDYQTNCYLISSLKNNTVIIDPGGDPELIIESIEKNNLVPKFIINTHGHVDHITANNLFSEKYKIPVYIHEAEKDFLNDNHFNMTDFAGVNYEPAKDIKFVKTGDVLNLDELEFKVFHTPGHTAGGITIRLENQLFTGDTIFRDSVGRTDLPTGSFKVLENSIKDVIFKFPDNYIIYPGHGPESTVIYEKENNPFIKII